MEHDEDVSTLLKASTEEMGIKLDPKHITMFLEYLEQLLVWNQTINLTSITTKKEIVIKHFVDSLVGLRAEPFVHQASVLDVGAGAGFPGIPIKIARPDLKITLVEPVKKKVSFLRYVIGSLKLNEIRVHEGTIEQFMGVPGSERSFDYIVTRALKYDVIMTYCSSLLRKGGKAIFYLSDSVPREALRKDFSIFREYSFELPGKLGKRMIATVSPIDK